MNDVLFEELTNPADPRLRDYVALRDVSLRKSLEAEEGLFIAEGEKIIRRASEAGYAPRSFLLAERWFFFAQANHPQNLYYQTIG